MYYEDIDVIALQIKNNSFLFLSFFSFIRGEMGGGGNWYKKHFKRFWLKYILTKFIGNGAEKKGGILILQMV